jgi:hypothetical protein
MHYTIQFCKTFSSFPNAQEAKEELDQLYPDLPNIEISYYMPQPEYKSWVPIWLIRLITKKYSTQ